MNLTGKMDHGSNGIPSTSHAVYGTVGIQSKGEKDHKNIGFTIFKAFETVSSLYCSYFLYQFFVHKDTLSTIYISWLVFSIIDVVVILDRLFNYQREAGVLVFEVSASLLGCITHVLCAISLMYQLNREKQIRYDTSEAITNKFMRYINPAVASTAVSCLYLMDCLLSADAMLDHWGIHTWSSPAFPNLQVDLLPSSPLRLVLPWETHLGRESIFSKFRHVRWSKRSIEDNEASRSNYRRKTY